MTAVLPPPSAANFSYVHDQMSAASVWTIVHNLNGFPSVTVVDSAGSEVIGDVVYDSPNQVHVNFSAPFAGQAFLS